MKTNSLNRYWNARLDPLDWKEPCARADARSWSRAYRSFSCPTTRDAIALLGDLRGKNVLELGSGQGYGSLHLAARGGIVTGIDVSERLCAVAAERTAGQSQGTTPRFCAANAERLPFADRSFDAIFARDVLMYSNPAAVLAECHRVLVEGGRVVFDEALDGGALIRWFRRRTSPSEYLQLTRHLSWNELAALDGSLQPLQARPYYLLSISAFCCLFLLRSVALYRLLLAMFGRLDAWLLKRFPRLAHVAWRATALYERSTYVE